MDRRTVISTLLVVMCCTSLAWAGVPDDYLIPGREKLFEGTLSGVRQAYQIFTNGIDDDDCGDNEVIRFFHAAAGTAMLAFRDDGTPINSFFELAREFGLEVLGDNWHQLAVYHPVNEHDAYEIPPGAPDESEIRSIFDTSMIPQVESLIADLDLISPPFEILLVPEETSIFSDPLSPPLPFDLEIDYAEVLLLKGLLMALKGQLQARSAYDMYVDPDNKLVEKLHSNSFNMNNDLLGPYSELLMVAPTTNNPEIGKDILAQARQDLINAIDYYFDAINHIRNETDDQEDDFLYIDPNGEAGLEVVDDRLTTLRDSLDNDTVGKYPWETARTYDIKNVGAEKIGELVVVYDISGLDGNKGSLTFTEGVAPTPWDVDWVGREGADLISVDVDYYENGQWRQGFLEGTLSPDHSTITNATFQYWGQESDTLSGLSGNLVGTQIVDASLDLNPIYGSTTRYPNPVNPRDLLPEFDEWNSPLPGTMGHGLGNDPTLGGILPDMSQQYDWQVQLELQPGGLFVVSSLTPTPNVDGIVSDWTSEQLVLDDISGDTEDPVSGMDIDKLYLTYDADYLYGAITFYDNISISIEYSYELILSYSPYDEALGAIALEIDVSGGSASSSLSKFTGNYPWEPIPGSEAVAGTNAVEFKIPLADINLSGRFISLESWGRNPVSSEWYDGEWNGTHLKIGGLGTNELGTISGTISYEDHISGAPIFVQAYTDPWDPEYSIVASTMITDPGAYTLTGIGIGFEGYVRAFTPLFGFNVFDLDALTIEASTSVTLSGSVLTGVDLVLGKPTTLPDGTWVQDQIAPNTYEKLYAFEAQKGNVYALDLTRETSQYACMSLFGRDGHTELEERYSGKWQHIDWICPETGIYYIEVSNHSQPDSGTYKLRIALQNSMPSGYEVWGGDTSYTNQPNWWEYYYNIDKQNYVKLGESTGGSATFDGDYSYYVIATHEPIPIDSVNGPNAQYYYGFIWSGNTLSPGYIIGPPDNQYATVGNWYSGGMNGTFEGFVIIDNTINNWDSLTVTVPDTGSISGKVVKHSDNTGMEGVRVELYTGDDENIADEHAWDHKGTTYTDSNGEYRFDLLPERRYRIRIPDWEVSGEHYFEVNLYDVQVNKDAETPNINASLRQAALIYGYVRTNTGSFIPDAWVIAQAPWTHDGQNWHNAWTDATGRYELWVAPSPGKFYPVWVREASLDGTDYASEWNGNFYKGPVPPAETWVPDYYLEPGGVVYGRVVNKSGVGIEGVWLEVEWSEGGVDIGPGTETDSNGDFVLRGCVPGINYICMDNGWREIQHAGVKYMVGEVCTGPVDVTVGEPANVGTFTIYEAGRVTGIVTDESGNPVVAAEVEVEGKDINGNWADRDDITDSFGQFTIDYVAPGTYRLSCYKDGFVTSFETGIIVERGQHVDHDMVMKSANEGATISGSITNYAAVASYDSEGILLPSYGDSEYNDYGYPEFGLLAISMQHNYTADDFLNIDDFFIGYADQEEIDDGYGDYFDDDADETPGNYQMALPSGDTVVGMYVSPSDLHGGVWWANLCDWKRFNFSKGDIRDNVDFTATTSGTGILNGNIIVPTGYNNFPDEWCMIYAYELDSNGNVINSLSPLGDAVASAGWTTTYEFRNLPAGDYRLNAYARNLPSVTISLVTVNSGTTTQNIDFTSAPSGTLTGHITDGVSDVNNAVVTIVENGRQAITDDSGIYTITGINTGTYTVMVIALGYADAQATVSIDTGPPTTQNFTLDSNVGSISGTVKDTLNNNINGATVVAYNKTDYTHKTTQTVAGSYTITGLTPGPYILAVDAGIYGVVIYPDDVTLAAKENKTGINIVVGTPEPPLFTVASSVSNDTPPVLSMEFYSDQGLNAEPAVSIVEGSGSLGSLTWNSALNRFNIDYTAHADDNLVVIRIAETVPLVPGNTAIKDFSFEVSTNLVTTSSTNVTNATGGTASMMGTQDNTTIYVPPFALAGVEDTQALTLTIERYGDPGQTVPGATGSTASAVYDFEFDQQGVTIDENHTFTVTMSFELPAGMTEEEFESSLELRYFDAGEQKWKTDGITNVRINWLNYTIMFEVSHLSKFAAFVPGEGIIGDFCGVGSDQPDGYVDVWDLMQFAQHWHTRPSDSNWDSKFDLVGLGFGDPDDYVDVWDLMEFAKHWHEGQKP